MNLAERASRARAIIGTLASEGRGPKMSVPVRDEDEDVFVCDTLYGLEAEVKRLSVHLAVLDGSACAEEQANGNGPCGVCKNCLRADLAAARARIPNPDDLRTVCDEAMGDAETPTNWFVVKDAVERVRATLPTTPELTKGDLEWQGRAAAAKANDDA